MMIIITPLVTHAQRLVLPLNDGWTFRFSHQVQKGSGVAVNLPHTWNNVDALSGKPDYKRGIGNYTRTLHVPTAWKGKRVFARFEGANTITDVLLNGHYVGEHRGGYTAFIFELTDLLQYGTDNNLWVRVNNGEQLSIMPLVGDFNFYGGLYRQVELIVTDPVCISPLDYASPGVYLRQHHVNEKQAEVDAKIILSNDRPYDSPVRVSIDVRDGERTIWRKDTLVTVLAKSNFQPVILPITFTHPHLWNGCEDPFMYQVAVALWQNNKKIDELVQPLGLRYFRFDPNLGFFLNGHHLALHGVCRHQDRAKVGNAISNQDIDEDMAIMREMGVNAVRLAHYPQSMHTYDMMDKTGIFTWAEIPFVGPGGYADKGFINTSAFKENGKQQLRELIRQNYNHPSIFLWSIFNELKYEGDNPIEYVKELNELAHQEDNTRMTTCASNQQGELNLITDVVAWNRYDGWYGDTPQTLATYLDNIHRTYPKRCIAISEYGAGASIHQQQDTLKQPIPNSWWHPENWQTYYHIRNWEIISQRPFIWGSFIWNMFDFGAAHRTEGDRAGINDKGLVTFDRQVKKDAYYFYKANWNPAPMVYIAGRRNQKRTHAKTVVTVFSNCKEVTLFINGEKISKLKPDNAKVCNFYVTLREGKNNLKAIGFHHKSRQIDTCEWTLN